MAKTKNNAAPAQARHVTRSVRRAERRTKTLMNKEQKGLNDIRKTMNHKLDTVSTIMSEVESQLVNKYLTRCVPAGDPLSDNQLDSYSEMHSNDPINVATENALATVPVSWLAENRKYISQLNYAYSHIPDHCPKPTEQAHSGRCWLFASLNTIRYHLIRNFNLNDHFELSEAYLFFFDKIERGLFFLEKMLEFRDQPIHDTVVNGMTTYFSPVTDGGTWSFFINLITRYGMVPKSCYGEAFNSNDTSEMNDILYMKLGQFGMEIRASKLADSTLQKRIREVYMPEIYSLMVKFMGEPPKVFNWDYHEVAESFEDIRQRGTYRSIQNLTPMKFYMDYIDAELHLEDKIVLRHDPRVTSPYYRTYHVKHFGAMVGGRPDIALNVPWEVFSSAAARSVMDGQQIWFAADVGKSMSHEHGILSTEAYNYEKILNTTLPVDKATGLDSHISCPSHAMALVGVDVLDEDPDQVIKWKVENSWGEYGGGDPGYLMMTQEWFCKYGYEVVIDPAYLDEKTYSAYKKYEYDPILLPYNDAFGAVARTCQKCVH